MTKLQPHYRNSNASEVRKDIKVKALSDEAVQLELEEYLAAARERLPHWTGRSIKWLREPSHRIIRIAISILLMAGSIFSFLPILGAWMLPLGLIIMSQDVPFLRRPLLSAFRWVGAKWDAWSNRQN